MINLNEFSTENLKKIQKILKILLDELELRGVNELTGTKIPLKIFEKEGFYYDEVTAILRRINKEGNIIEITNEELKASLKDLRGTGVRWPGSDTRFDEIYDTIAGFTEEDLERYLILMIENLEKLKEIKQTIDKKLTEGVESMIKIRDKKIKAKYDKEILYLKDKEINFSNKPNQKELLATLFEEPEKNWSYDEIQEKWDEMMESGLVDRPEDYWKKFYSAGDDINTAVAIETQIKDFIIKNTKEIRINPKYI